MLAETSTDGILVLRAGQGRLRAVLRVSLTAARPHLCHSITKSIASCVAANLVEPRVISTRRPGHATRARAREQRLRRRSRPPSAGHDRGHPLHGGPRGRRVGRRAARSPLRRQAEPRARRARVRLRLRHHHGQAGRARQRAALRLAQHGRARLGDGAGDRHADAGAPRARGLVASSAPRTTPTSRSTAPAARSSTAASAAACGTSRASAQMLAQVAAAWRVVRSCRAWWIDDICSNGDPARVRRRAGLRRPAARLVVQELLLGRRARRAAGVHGARDVRSDAVR